MNTNTETTTTTEKPQTRLEELRAKHERELQAIQAEEAIAALLPASLKLPCISNITDEEGEPHAWLSFSPEYSADGKQFALSVFTELEKAGFAPVPASLCKWDNYRRSVSPGLTTDIPATKRGSFRSNYELKDVTAIAPLWVTPCQYTGVEAKAFYSLNGRIYKVSVKAPLAVHLSCRRSEIRGDWHYEGPCTVHFPKAWHSVHTPQGESVANISAHAQGYKDTDKGISGNVYWDSLTEQQDFPLTPAQFLTALFALQS